MTETENEIEIKPILFHQRSMNGILDQRKSQTRRIIKEDQLQGRESVEDLPGPGDEVLDYVCPYGKPGDLLWARENFRISQKDQGGFTIRYETDPAVAHWSGPLEGEAYDQGHRALQHDGWRPNIFMPKWACRRFLVVEDIRVEHIQDISEEDALAEGVNPRVVYPSGGLTPFDADPRMDFADLWNETNGEGAWERNDPVWVVEWSMVLDPPLAKTYVGREAWEAWLA